MRNIIYKFILVTSLSLALVSCSHGVKESSTNSASEEQRKVSPEDRKGINELMEHEMHEQEEMKNNMPKESPYKNSKIDIATFKNSDGTYGYSVAIDGRTYINQPNIPPLPGIKGLNKADQAKITGEYVAHKIRNNIMPPSISVPELDSLGVLK